MYKRGDSIMEKGLKLLFGGLIAAVVMMFMLMVSSVGAHETDNYWHPQQGQHMYHMYEACPNYPSVVIPNQQQNTSSSQNFINNSVTRDNNFQPNVTVNTPKPQR